MSQPNPNQMPLEQQVQTVYQQLQLIEQQIKLYQEQLEAFSQLYTELSLTISTLDGLKNADENQEILIPVGSGAYVWANIKDKNKVLTLVGARLHIEKDIDSAKKTVHERRLRVEEMIKNIGAEIQRLSADRDRLIQFLEQVNAKLSQSKS